MMERRTEWTRAENATRGDQPDGWTEPKGLVNGVVLLPHGPLPVCDSWWLELTSTVKTRPHVPAACESLGQVSVPMS